jgi:hypothetical protein
MLSGDPGVQETMQLLLNASNVHYGLIYVALFALPLFGGAGFRSGIPAWLRIVSVAGLISSLVAVLIAIHPIIGERLAKPPVQSVSLAQAILRASLSRHSLP